MAVPAHCTTRICKGFQAREFQKMKNNHNKWRLNRIASALAVALLPLCEDVLARDVFNPALLEMDGPHTGVRDLSAYEQAGGQLPAPIGLIFILITNLWILAMWLFSRAKSGNNGITALPDGRRSGRMGRTRLPISRAGPQVTRMRGYQRDTAGKIRFSLQPAAPAIELPAGGGNQRRTRLGGSETVG
jgi:hypothetical protein